MWPRPTWKRTIPKRPTPPSVTPSTPIQSLNREPTHWCQLITRPCTTVGLELLLPYDH